MPNKPQIKPAVLIVDAAEPFATELCRSLGPLCGLVERADAPPLARALLERYHFDFLVADVGAEALETQEALDALVAAGGSAQLVALCSRPSKERAVAALRAGAVEFIEKP
ncbi:MAG TPA: response regulator, partial [Chromatiales bacterium]|nr:response regulator [Chromatiales bacterium]